MMSFLPYPSFEASAAVLDQQRLNKQRSEALQMLLTLTGRSGQWRNHPATRMWRGYEASLASYALAVCAEWVHRGYKDTVSVKVAAIVKKDELDLVNAPQPPWLGDTRLHSSHRSNLLRKREDHYGLLGWTELPNQLYYWPPEADRELPLPRRATKMDESAKAAETASATLSPLQVIEAEVAAAKAAVNPAVGPANVKRFNARLDAVVRIAKVAFDRYGKQLKYATRPKRVKKEEPVAAAK